MAGWIIAALVGAVPLYLGFAFGRARVGMPLLTGIGALLSLAVLGIVVATSAAGEGLILGGLGVTYLSGVALLGALAGMGARLALGPGGDGPRN